MNITQYTYIKIFGTLVGLVLTILLVSSRYQVSLVPTALGCLPIKAAVIDSKNHHPKRGQLMSFLSDNAEPYFAHGTNFLKIAAGIAGDTVTIDLDGVTVTTDDGQVTRYAADARRMMKYAQIDAETLIQTFVVPQGHYFALGTLPTSFDSRYWGLVEHSQIIGVGYAFL
ncbi:S26 family signal peptidase [Vibrio cyclitrophicus]